MSQETTVRPEPVVKIFMALAVLSLITIAVCQVILVIRPSQPPVMRRPVLPVENRMTQQGMPPFPPGMPPFPNSQGQGAGDGMRPNPGNPQPVEKPAKR
ncbi:MAG: hypothetical protein EBQ51_03410 [Verrucomicrobia bacterium]|nr:hypothetical protein [Pseudomonadota bacterium]NBS06580.1 hypothetical protein [Verrucomicrobiota bacterium]NBS79080.1 hypothetical protein [bacterium]NBS49511.1 hypothetical protein [Verrucomicrobiota bacterium]NBT23999.1 hypothetical protein [bacterium]